MPKLLRRSEQGRKRCFKDGKLSICVEGGKFGFQAWLVGQGGGRLPISTTGPGTRNPARTLESAVKNTRAAMKRIKKMSKG